MIAIEHFQGLVAAIGVTWSLGWIAVVGFGWIGLGIGATLTRLPWIVSIPIYVIIGLLVLLLGLLLAFAVAASIGVVMSSIWDRTLGRKRSLSRETR